jgi:hypothetical protein
MRPKPQTVLLHHEIKRVLKADIEPEIYRKFSHFVYLTIPLRESIPGSYSIYYMYKGGLAIATNALCINEWLTLHNLPTKRPLSHFTCTHRIKANIPMEIDNRTKEWTKELPPPVIPVFKIKEDSKMSDTVWDLYNNQNCSTKQIAKVLNFTVPNVYYHLKKKRKQMS